MCRYNRSYKERWNFFLRRGCVCGGVLFKGDNFYRLWGVSRNPQPASGDWSCASMYIGLGWLPHKDVWLWWRMGWNRHMLWQVLCPHAGLFHQRGRAIIYNLWEKNALWCLMVLQGWRGYLGITVRKTRIKRYWSQYDTSRKLWWKHGLCVIRDQEYRRMSASKYPTLHVESNESSEIRPLTKMFWRSIEWF